MSSRWIYNDYEKADVPVNASRIIGIKVCRYCGENITTNAHPKSRPRVSDTTIGLCQICGWWVIRNDYLTYDGDEWHEISGAQGVLKQLDTTDVSLPIEELLPYLKANYEDRLKLHPRRYEDVVAAIFKNEGHEVLATSYSNDGGIDLFVFESGSSSCFGVQIKRYKDKIGVEQIRSFAGALVINDLTKGVFVTTSEYTRGAKSSAKKFSNKGFPIELVDSHSFYDRLKLVKNEGEMEDYIEVYEAFSRHNQPYPILDRIFLRSPN